MATFAATAIACIACHGQTLGETAESGPDVVAPSATGQDATPDRTVGYEAPDADMARADRGAVADASLDRVDEPGSSDDGPNADQASGPEPGFDGEATADGPSGGGDASLDVLTDVETGGLADGPLDGPSEGSAPDAPSGMLPTGVVYIKPSNTKPGVDTSYVSDFNFGFALALQGDTLVVGAPFESSNGSGINGDQSDESLPNAGAVYVFTRSGSTWSQQAYIKPSNGGSAMNFGWSVALDGDTLVVGARLEASAATGIDGNQNDTSMSGDGAVYVFTRSGTTWSQQAYVKAGHAAMNQWCGFAVAVSGDTLAFSCPEDLPGLGSTGGNVVGSVYVLTRAAGVWTQQAFFPPNAYGVGASLALQGDLLAAGVPYQVNPADGSSRNQGGIVEVFSRNGTTWTQETLLSANLGPAGDRGPPTDDDKFGTTMALSNGTLVVSAPEETFPLDGSPNGIQGAAYVFARSGTTWSGQARLTVIDAQLDSAPVGGAFANSVALDGERIVVGVPRSCPCEPTDLGILSSGEAAVFTRSGTTWSWQSNSVLPRPPAGTYGNTVAISGTTIAAADLADSSGAVGIDGDNTNTSSPGSGAVYVLQ